LRIIFVWHITDEGEIIKNFVGMQREFKNHYEKEAIFILRQALQIIYKEYGGGFNCK
jgi:hypothetical protein